MLATFVALTGQDPDSLENKDSVNMLPALLKNPQANLRHNLLLTPKNSKSLSLRSCIANPRQTVSLYRDYPNVAGAM